MANLTTGVILTILILYLSHTSTSVEDSKKVTEETSVEEKSDLQTDSSKWHHFFKKFGYGYPFGGYGGYGAYGGGFPAVSFPAYSYYRPYGYYGLGYGYPYGYGGYGYGYPVGYPYAYGYGYGYFR